MWTLSKSILVFSSYNFDSCVISYKLKNKWMTLLFLKTKDGLSNLVKDDSTIIPKIILSNKIIETRNSEKLGQQTKIISEERKKSACLILMIASKSMLNESLFL